MLVGGLNAVLRGSLNVGLFSALTGINCALLGSSYWGVLGPCTRVSGTGPDYI